MTLELIRKFDIIVEFSVVPTEVEGPTVKLST